MSECGTNIVDCLRNKKIEPIAYSSSVRKLKDDYPQNALNYTVQEPYFHSGDELGPWWMIDFKRIVTIHTYLLNTFNYCGHIRKWNVSISNNNRTWKVIDSPPEDGFPINRNYTLNRIYSTRFFKITKNETTACLQKSFAFCYIMFFGSINKVPFFDICTVCRKGTINHSIFFVILLII